MHFRTIDRAPEKHFSRENAVPGVEEQAVKLFVRKVREAHAEEILGGGRVTDGPESVQSVEQDGFGSMQDVFVAGERQGVSRTRFGSSAGHRISPSTVWWRRGIRRPEPSRTDAPNASAIARRAAGTTWSRACPCIRPDSGTVVHEQAPPHHSVGLFPTHPVKPFAASPNIEREAFHVRHRPLAQT